MVGNLASPAPRQTSMKKMLTLLFWATTFTIVTGGSTALGSPGRATRGEASTASLTAPTPSMCGRHAATTTVNDDRPLKLCPAVPVVEARSYRRRSGGSPSTYLVAAVIVAAIRMAFKLFSQHQNNQPAPRRGGETLLEKWARPVRPDRKETTRETSSAKTFLPLPADDQRQPESTEASREPGA